MAGTAAAIPARAEYALGSCDKRFKKLWKSYKIAGRTGEPRSNTAWKINRIQGAMGLEKSEFPELEGNDEWHDQDQDQSQSEELPTEWSAKAEQLRHEEREAEQENDDWGISD